MPPGPVPTSGQPLVDASGAESQAPRTQPPAQRCPHAPASRVPFWQLGVPSLEAQDLEPAKLPSGLGLGSHLLRKLGTPPCRRGARTPPQARLLWPEEEPAQPRRGMASTPRQPLRAQPLSALGAQTPLPGVMGRPVNGASAPGWEQTLTSASSRRSLRTRENGDLGRRARAA